MRLAYRHTSGFTIVEVLIASALSVAVLLTLSQLFFTMTQSQRQQASLQAVQENGRFAVFSLNHAIQMASAIEGWSARNVPSFWGINAKVNTDVIALREIRQEQGQLSDVISIYFIAPTSHHTEALYVKTMQAGEVTPRLELVDGVDNLQLYFGATDGTNIVGYFLADQVTNWRKIKAVAVSFNLISGKSQHRITKTWYSYVMRRNDTENVTEAR